MRHLLEGLLGRLAHRLRMDERGMALPITLGISCVFAITGTTIVVYSSGLSRHTYYSTNHQSAGALAEAGLNNALAVVFKPGNNPLNPYLFCSAGETHPCPQRTATVDGQTIGWTGTLDQSQSPLNPVTSGVHVGGGCKPNGLTIVHSPCTVVDSVYASPAADTNVATLAAPQPAWSTWYLSASPGPYYPCATVSGSPPAFDNDQGAGSSPDAGKENLSLTGAGGVVYLTGATSYTCRTSNGELSWNGSAKLLTVNGAIFIDGNVRIDSSGTIAYTGMGTIFTSGSFVLKGTNLCAVVAANGRDCDWQTGAGHWDPNTRFLEIVAGDKQACCAPDIPPGDVSVELNSVSFQGGVEAVSRIDVGTSSSTQGPLIARSLTAAQSLTTYPFPSLTNVPVGTPGNQPVLPTAQRPQSFSG